MKEASITILIPVFNRADALGIVFPSYVHQHYLKKIVLVDDGSTDKTPDVMQKLQSKSVVQVEIVRHDRRLGQPQARLSALTQVDSEWVIFGEDDVFLAPEYASTLLRQAQELKADLIAGRLVNVPFCAQVALEDLLEHEANQEGPNDLEFDLSLFRASFNAYPEQPAQVPFLHTVALLRRKVFETVSFDPAYAGNSVREETDFCLAARSSGYRVFFTPDTVCFHLRGQIADSGGQRMSRLKMEYWNLVNTRRLVTKHWTYLREAHGFHGSPDKWMMSYIWQRYKHVLKHALTGRTLQPKNRL